MNTAPRALLRFIPILSLIAVSLAPRIQADSKWMGPSGTQAWNVGANWEASVVPGAIGVSTFDLALFETNAGPTAITVDPNRWIGGLGFFVGSGAFTIGSAGANQGNALHMADDSVIYVDFGVTNNITINAPLVIEPSNPTDTGALSLQNLAVDGAMGPLLIVGGSITGGTTTQASTLFLQSSVGTRANVASANLVSGVISDGASAGGLSVEVRSISNAGASPERGAWNLTGLNTYTGDTVVASGALYFNSIGKIGQASALGAGDTFSIGNGAIVLYTGAAAETDRIIVSNGGTWFNNTSGVAITINSAGSVNLPGTLTFRGGGNFVIDALVSGAGGLSRTDGGTVFLNNVANEFLGNLSISTGAFNAKSIARIGTASAIGKGSVGGTISLGQNQLTVPVGRLTVSSATGGVTDRAIVLNNGANSPTTGSGGILENSVAGQTITFENTVKANSSTAAHASYLELTGVGNGVMKNVIGGTNADAAANINMQLVKSGTGTWELNGANRYYRGTVISAGTLLVNNLTGSGTGTGAVTTSGTGTLGGKGFIRPAAGNAVSIATGTKLMIGNTHGGLAGAMGSNGYLSEASQLSIGDGAAFNLTLAGTLQFDLFGASDGIDLGVSDVLKLSTTGTITAGGTISVADVTGQTTGWSSGIWQLVDWGGNTPSGTFTFDFASTLLAEGYTWDTSDFYSNGTISIMETPTWTWTGAVSNSWGDAGNWTAGSVPTSTSDVIFGQAGAANTTNVINDNRNVKNIIFNGLSNYTINMGTTGVLYSHGNLLRVDGGTHTLGAQVRVANGSGGDYQILNNGTLTANSNVMFHRLAGTGNLRFVVDGTGNTSLPYFTRRNVNYDASVLKKGSGTLTLNGGTDVAVDSASGAYITGTFTIEEGKVRINDERNFGGNPAAFNAAQLTINGGTLSAYASVTIDDANRGVTLGANDATIEVENAAHTLTVANVVTGEGDLQKTGPGTLAMSGANTYTGNTTVSSGILLINNLTGSGTGTGSVNVASGATLGGTGSLSGGSVGSITLGTNTQLRVGSTHGAGGVGQDLRLGMGGNVDVSLNGTLQFDLTGAGSFADLGDASYNTLNLDAPANDLLEIETTGGLNLNGAKVQVSAESALAFVDGYTWKLIDWSNVTLENLSYEGMRLETLSLNGFSLTQIFADDGYYIRASVVPEPGRVMLLMLALFGLMMRRRR